MKRHAWILILISIAVLALQSCTGFKTVRGSGKAAQEDRQVSDFTGVELATIGNLYIEQGDKEALRIEADDNLLRYFETRVSGNTLKIESPDRVTLLPDEPVYFYLTVKRLDKIALAGLGSIELPEKIEAGQLSVTISGSGHVEVEDLSADVFEVTISGLGDLYVDEGKVAGQKVTISGGGNYRAQGLDSDTAEVNVSGLGSATVRVRERLKVTISGGGAVRYVGNPTVEQDVSGVGHVERIGE